MEPSCVLQTLAYMRLMLQQLPSCRQLDDYEPADGSRAAAAGALSFSSMWELLLLLALKQEQPDIRCGAAGMAGACATDVPVLWASCCSI